MGVFISLNSNLYSFFVCIYLIGGKLELFNADLMKEGSFDEAIKGATVVIHTAAVVTIVAKDPQRDIIDPAINGTKNILSAIKKSGTVKT